MSRTEQHWLDLYHLRSRRVDLEGVADPWDGIKVGDYVSWRDERYNQIRLWRVTRINRQGMVFGRRIYKGREPMIHERRIH